MPLLHVRTLQHSEHSLLQHKETCLKIMNFLASILKAKSKCVVNIFVKLFFMKPIFDKHLPSSTLPITMVVDNSMSFSHSYSL
jgi:hypothetical protein